MVSEDSREIDVSVFPPGSFWFLHLAAPAGQELLPGVYEGATRWPFQDPSTPGLDFSGDGRGCNTLTGRFPGMALMLTSMKRLAASSGHCFPRYVFMSVVGC